MCHLCRQLLATIGCPSQLIPVNWLLITRKSCHLLSVPCIVYWVSPVIIANTVRRSSFDSPLLFLCSLSFVPGLVLSIACPLHRLLLVSYVVYYVSIVSSLRNCCVVYYLKSNPSWGRGCRRRCVRRGFVGVGRNKVPPRVRRSCGGGRGGRGSQFYPPGRRR